ncbi:hypothetical protein BC332_02785 [Capsicum chinense]|nr:hypothetical protein BC332_02785 [Capsicum chinense]
MGRENRACQSKQHFSHPHILKLINQAESENLTCSACEQPNITNKPNFYGCNSCQYILHEYCLDAPRFLDHSSHPSHHLTLLPLPTYSSRSYTCNACGSAGNGFSFSCARCDFDIHTQCALLPQNVFLSHHHHHELELIFESPFDDDTDDENIVFVCDICHDNVDLKNWLYYCADCDFGAHIRCGISKHVSQLEPKLQVVNKPRANPVLTTNTEEDPIKIREINQAEEEEEEEEEEKTEEEEEEEEEEEDEDEKVEVEEIKIPKSILIDKHLHELELCFGSPYEDKDIIFVCDICNIIMDSDESLYYCADCDFGTHLQCASPDPSPTSEQRRNNINANSAVEMINSVR